MICEVVELRGAAVTRGGMPRFGAWVKIPAPESVELLALAGFDFVVIDAEHAAIASARRRR